MLLKWCKSKVKLNGQGRTFKLVTISLSLGAYKILYKGGLLEGVGRERACAKFYKDIDKQGPLLSTPGHIYNSDEGDFWAYTLI